MPTATAERTKRRERAIRSWPEVWRYNPLLVSTRFYLPSSGAASVSPAFAAAWEDTSSAVRRAMVTDKIASAMADELSGTLSLGDNLIIQYVSDPLDGAQTIWGNMKLQIRAREGNALLDSLSKLGVFVYSNDGTTLRGTLLAVADYSTGAEWNSTYRNKVFADGDVPTPVSALDGDRIVIEIGANMASVISTSDISLGDDSATDLPEDETTTDANNPWFQIGQILKFQASNIPALGTSTTKWDTDSPAFLPPYRLRSIKNVWIEGQQGVFNASNRLNQLIGQDQIYGASGESPTPDWTQFGPQVVFNKRQQSEKQYLHSQQDVLGNLTFYPDALEQGTLYGEYGQVWPTDWTQNGVQHAQKKWRLSHIEHTRPETPNFLIPSLIGQDVFYGDPGLSWPTDWTQFGLPVAIPKRQQSEKQWLHSAQDVWVNDLPRLDAIVEALLHQPPDWTQFGIQHITMARARAMKRWLTTEDIDFAALYTWWGYQTGVVPPFLAHIFFTERQAHINFTVRQANLNFTQRMAKVAFTVRSAWNQFTQRSAKRK